MKIDIVLAEFGRPEPDTAQYRRVFPNATVRIFGDADARKCEWLPQFDGPRSGHRMNDFWKAQLALISSADVVIVVDADMRIVDDDGMRQLPVLAERFGLCLPANPRYLVAVDGTIGADPGKQASPAAEYGHAVNCSPIAFSTHHGRARYAVETYCQSMLDTPARGPVVWWRAFWKTGFFPCLLPPQWCVCQEHVGIGNEIMLHVGHEKVRKHYGKAAA